MKKKKKRKKAKSKQLTKISKKREAMKKSILRVPQVLFFNFYFKFPSVKVIHTKSM